MTYLCMIVQREMADAQRFDSRELAEDYFRQRFGRFLEEKVEEELVLHLAGVFHIGDTYQVTEERYYCTKLKIAGEKGILEARKAIPEYMITNSIFLEICRESPEAEVRMRQKRKRMAAQIKREFRNRIKRSWPLEESKAE